MRGSCLQLAYKVPVLGSQDLPGSQRAKTERLGPRPPGHGAARLGSGRLSRCPALPGSPRAVAMGRSSFSADRKCVAFLPAPGGPRPGASGRCRRWLCRMPRRAGGLPHRFHFQKTQLFFISSLVFLFLPFFPPFNRSSHTSTGQPGSATPRVYVAAFSLRPSGAPCYLPLVLILHAALLWMLVCAPFWVPYSCNAMCGDGCLLI